MPHGRHAPGGHPGSRAGAAAVELRVAGASFTDIAHTLGLSSPQEALGVVENELACHLSQDDVDKARAQATLRLEALLAAVWPKAQDVEHPEQLPATRTALAIVDRLVRLHGLDRPTELILHTPSATELEAWVAGMVAHTVPPVIEADIVGPLGIGTGE